jgi:hypothetical protein
MDVSDDLGITARALGADALLEEFQKMRQQFIEEQAGANTYMHEHAHHLCDPFQSS